jgi:hypothetical protein
LGEYGLFRLSHSLRLAGRAAAVAQNGLDLNLPPITGPGEGLGSATLGALASLYLQAELEQAGVIPAAEAVVDARTALDLPTESGAEKLEQFAQRERNWYDRNSRNQLFARVFGIGPGATPDAGASVNREFEQRLAVLCLAISRYGIDQTGAQTGPSADEAQVVQAANDLLANLEMRQYGNTVFAVRRIQEQLEAAINLLKDPDIESIFHAKGFWATLAQVLEPNVPDIARIVERGQAGQHLMTWLATAGPGVTNALQPLVPPNSPVFDWAAHWLEASGLGVTADAARRVA